MYTHISKCKNDKIKIEKDKVWGWGCTLIVECLHTMYKALRSISSTVTKEKKEDNRCKG
jgi:hypothetical protein